VVELLKDKRKRAELPGVMWQDPILGTPIIGSSMGAGHHLAPAIDDLPFVDRRFLTDDPYRANDGRIEANMVGARGCPYDCSFCGAAVSANPEITIRTRTPENIIQEMRDLDARYGVTAFRFVNDLFLGYERFIRKCMTAFSEAAVGGRYAWDATGRINILHRMNDDMLELLKRNGCREVALGIESGSERLLTYMGKRITPEMTRSVVRRLTEHGISIKGYYILGFPTETCDELNATMRQVYDLWDIAEAQPGRVQLLSQYPVRSGHRQRNTPPADRAIPRTASAQRSSRGMNDRRGFFIAVEGPSGVGKTTVTALLPATHRPRSARTGDERAF